MISLFSSLRILGLIFLLIMGLVLLEVAGCSSSDSSTERPGLSDKQKQAMNDPMGYSPTNHDPQKAEEAANKKNERPNTLKSDWDRLWNP